MNALSLVEKIACLSGEDKSHLEWLVDRFLVHSVPKKGCDCHVLDPKKQDMIIWLSNSPKHPDDLIVRVADQKFIGMPRIDKRGQKYWKVREFYEDGENEPVITRSITSSLTKEELELVKSYRKKAANGLPGLAFSEAEEKAYQKMEKEQKASSPELVQGGINAN